MAKVKDTGCCKRFDPKPWDKKTIKWTSKLFVKGRVGCLFYMPVGLGGFMKRVMKEIDESKALAKTDIMLMNFTSMWGADIYVHVAKPVKGLTTTKLSGTFMSKVYEGPYNQTGKWVQDMEKYVKSKKKKMKKIYYFYTTCPKCAKEYGKNYTVLLAQI